MWLNIHSIKTHHAEAPTSVVLIDSHLCCHHDYLQTLFTFLNWSSTLRKGPFLLSQPLATTVLPPVSFNMTTPGILFQGIIQYLSICEFTSYNVLKAHTYITCQTPEVSHLGHILYSWRVRFLILSLCHFPINFPNPLQYPVRTHSMALQMGLQCTSKQLKGQLS